MGSSSSSSPSGHSSAVTSSETAEPGAPEGDAVVSRVRGRGALLAIIASLLLHKEFALVAFNEDFARVQGWPTHTLDLALMGLVVLVTVVGLQAGLSIMIEHVPSHMRCVAALVYGLNASSSATAAASSSRWPLSSSGSTSSRACCAGVSLLTEARSGLARLSSSSSGSSVMSRHRLSRLRFFCSRARYSSIETHLGERARRGRPPLWAARI